MKFKVYQYREIHDIASSPGILFFDPGCSWLGLGDSLWETVLGRQSEEDCMGEITLHSQITWQLLLFYVRRKHLN